MRLLELSFVPFSSQSWNRFPNLVDAIWNSLCLFPIEVRSLRSFWIRFQSTPPNPASSHYPHCCQVCWSARDLVVSLFPVSGKAPADWHDMPSLTSWWPFPNPGASASPHTAGVSLKGPRQERPCPLRSSSMFGLQYSAQVLPLPLPETRHPTYPSVVSTLCAAILPSTYFKAFI